jgi:hypothetical protein
VAKLVGAASRAAPVRARAKPRLVIIKEFRVPVGGWVYAFPAGLLEDVEEYVLMVFVDVKAETGAIAHLEQPEELEVQLLDHKAVCALCDDPTAQSDAKMCTVLLMYKLLGKLE